MKNEIIKLLLEQAVHEKKEVWFKLSYRDPKSPPTMNEVTDWAARILELDAIIEFLKKALK